MPTGPTARRHAAYPPRPPSPQHDPSQISARWPTQSTLPHEQNPDPKPTRSDGPRQPSFPTPPPPPYGAHASSPAERGAAYRRSWHGGPRLPRQPSQRSRGPPNSRAVDRLTRPGRYWGEAPQSSVLVTANDVSREDALRALRGCAGNNGRRTTAGIATADTTHPTGRSAGAEAWSVIHQHETSDRDVATAQKLSRRATAAGEKA